MASDDDDEDLVLLRECAGVVEAKALQAMLQAEGIEAHVHGEHHRAQLGFLGAYVGLRLTVRRRDLDDARELVEEADYAEHLPADDDGAPDDPSVLRWREHAVDEPEDAPGPADGLRPRSTTVAVFVALAIGFGAGHVYARRGAIAAALLVAQMFLVGLTFTGELWALGLGVVLRLLDAAGSAIAIARGRQALPSPPPS